MSELQNPADCPHENFAADFAVQRIGDGDGNIRNFVAEVQVRCTDCGSPFHFLGADAWLSFTRPTVSVGATTLHAPIAPGVAPLPARIQFEIPPKRSEAS